MIKSISRRRTPSKPPGKTHMASLVIQNIVIDHENYFIFPYVQHTVNKKQLNVSTRFSSNFSSDSEQQPTSLSGTEKGVLCLHVVTMVLQNII